MPHTKTKHHASTLTTPFQNDTIEPPLIPNVATQIVEHHSRNVNQDQPGSKAAFSQLLLELKECPSAIDADVHRNHKLITVVAEAGFNGILHHSPIEQHGDLDVVETLACLDVIQTAIKCTPEVIFCRGLEVNDHESELLASLLPVLFALFHTTKDISIRTRTQDLLELFLTVFTKSFKHRSLLWRVVQVYQICVEGM